MNMILRVIATVALMAVLFFCVFGFLASNEFTEASKRLPQQMVYGAIGLACLVGAFRLLRRRRQPPGGATKRSAEQNGRWGVGWWVVAGLIVGVLIGTVFQCVRIWPEFAKLGPEFARRLHFALSGGAGESSDWGEPLFYMALMSVPSSLIGGVVGMALAFTIRRCMKTESNT